MSPQAPQITCTARLSPAGLAFLRADPLAHELLLGLWAQRSLAHARGWWVLCCNQEVVGVARFDPPISLIFSTMPPWAARALGQELAPFALAAEDVHAPAQLETTLNQVLGLGPEPKRSQVLGLFSSPRAQSSAGVLARVDESVGPWVDEAVRACLVERTGTSKPPAIAYWTQNGEGYLWRDPQGEAVALVIRNRVHDWGACLGLVYTVPEHRRRGYAKAMLSGVCAHLFEEGHTAVFLQLGADQASTKALYAGLGFELVQELVSWNRADGQGQGTA